MGSSEDPFSFLRKTIKILIHNTSKHTTEGILQTISDNPIYDISIVDYIKDLAIALDSKRYHVGILGSSEEETAFLRRNYKTFYLIVPTDTSFHAGFKCAIAGAKGYFDSFSGGTDKLKDLIWHTAILNILNPLYSNHNGYLAKSTEAIMSKDIRLATDLSKSLQVTERHLRNVWKILSITTKKAVMIHNTYKDAYDYLERNKFKRDIYNKQKDFFMRHKKEIFKYISE